MTRKEMSKHSDFLYYLCCVCTWISAWWCTDKKKKKETNEFSYSNFFMKCYYFHYQNNVQGRRCSTCKEGYFNLNRDNEMGCQRCFCMGVSNQCSSSTYYRDEVRKELKCLLFIRRAHHIVLISQGFVKIKNLNPHHHWNIINLILKISSNLSSQVILETFYYLEFVMNEQASIFKINEVGYSAKFYTSILLFISQLFHC